MMYLRIISFLICVSISHQRRWHAYDSKKLAPQTDQCREFDHEHATTNTSRIIDEFKLWPGALASSSFTPTINPNATVYGFGRAMKTIWQHQHPKDCSNAKFLLNGFHYAGIGSILHVAGAGLGFAMDLDRVYLQNPFSSSATKWEWDVPFCKEHSPSSIDIDCYYEPWSSCTIFDALGPNATTILSAIASHRYRDIPATAEHLIDHLYLPEGIRHIQDLTQYQIDKLIVANSAQNEKSSRVLIIGQIQLFQQGFVPRVFRSLLECSPVSLPVYYYWWRAISVTYVTRPKDVVVTWLRNNTMHDELLLQQQDGGALGVGEEGGGGVAAVYVSVYIRRGDKATEMHLVPFSRYTDAIDMIYDSTQGLLPLLPSPSSNKKRQQHHHPKKRIIFMASEDSLTMQNMSIWSQFHNYSMYSTNLFNRSGLFAEYTATERKHKAPVHHPLEYLSMLLNIHYLIQGEAFVCTMASNFCRLVDELRATVGGRADRAYLDLSEETCSGRGLRPPCIDQVGYFDWRRRMKM